MKPLHISDAERDNYEKTITRLQKANSLSRILVVLIFIMVAIGLFLIFQSNNQQAKRAAESSRQNAKILAEIQKTSNEQNKLTTEQLTTVNRHIDCIVLFFTNPNRANLKIDDINSCTFNQSASIIPTESNDSNQQYAYTQSSQIGQQLQPSNQTMNQNTAPSTEQSKQNNESTSEKPEQNEPDKPAIPEKPTEKCTVNLLNIIKIGCK